MTSGHLEHEDIEATLLVVDDEPNIRELLSTSLRFAGFDVISAGNGAEALRLAEQNEPDLLVLDVMLPDMDGFTVTRRLRQTGRHIPVVFLTARDDTSDKITGLTVGGDDYVTKPFSLEEVVARIRAVLRRTRHDGPPLATAPVLVSTFGLRLDRTSRRVWLGDRELVITPKGVTLLEYLMVHRDELIERQRLLEVLWGFDDAVGTRAVDSRVAELRRVLGEDASNPRWIGTVQGRGYRFVAEVTGAENARP